MRWQAITYVVNILFITPSSTITYFTSLKINLLQEKGRQNPKEIYAWSCFHQKPCLFIKHFIMSVYPNNHGRFENLLMASLWSKVGLIYCTSALTINMKPISQGSIKTVPLNPIMPSYSTVHVLTDYSTAANYVA